MNGPISTRVGLLRIEGALVALPVDVLREVLPMPERFDPLPTAAPGLVGALLLRNSVLPVLDLGALSGTPRSTPAMGVVVLVHEGRALGLLVDSVHDVVDLETAALQPVADPQARLFAATFVRPGTDEIGSLLDPAAVLGFPGVLAMAATDLGGTAFSGGGDGDHEGTALGPAYLVVRCRSAQGSVLLAVDVAEVRTTLPSLTPGPSQLRSDICLGVTDYGDVRLPVVDPLRLLDLPPTDGAGPWQALLVRSERGALALVFDEALDIVRPGPLALSPTPPGAGRGHSAVRAVARLPHGHAFVLDVATLLSDPEVSALTSLNTSSKGGVQDAVAAAPQHEPVVLFGAHGTLTTPLDQVDGVVPFPADPVPWIGGGSTLGTLVTEHDVVPLVDLAARLGRGPLEAPTAGVVLLVRIRTNDPDAPPQRVGFVVEALTDIERPYWREELAAAAQEERSPLVRTGSATGPLLPCLDLLQIAGAVLGSGRRGTAQRLVYPASTGYVAPVT